MSFNNHASHQDDDMLYDEYENEVRMRHNNRQDRRKRKPKPKHVPKLSQEEILENIADLRGLEGGFNPTYEPTRHESTWLLSAVREFYDRRLITDIEASIKGGKEASVYRCTAHPETGERWFAVKVYRPRMFRNLRNDAMYREGRDLLTEDGRPVKKTDTRVMRALNKKTDFGLQVSHTSWLMYEYKTLNRLYHAGAAVPRVMGASDNAILMSYIGDDGGAAPPLSEIQLERDEAHSLYREVLRNIELMLQNHLIHGDLSAYNILYYEGAITLIDFPQVIDAFGNSHAHAILARDVERITSYFARCGVEANAAETTAALWKRYVERDARLDAADLSRLLEQD
ncbi:RIO1 family regulatory kinase/ATPase [Geitlerinema splendidum]|nr:RIO1 family regulatory kinase/ATPase [Geitlerinema splendidum]